ncbi:MAG: transcription elongation factor GreA [candidate division Zixibacteria bacterium]|nr:transcription elongation factor GreA [candidate division Zixibacteria bacterium]
MNKPTYMSREGIKKLENELKHLKFKERPKIVAEIKRSMELGDLSENAEYHAAKEKQRMIEGKLADLEFKLSQVQPVDVDSIPTDKVYLYAKVLVKDYDMDEEIEYTIAPPEEADVYNDVISIKSPIGVALLGKEVGDVVDVVIPAGKIKLEVLKISRD